MDWIAIGLCADVPKGTVVPRRVKDIDLALWCGGDGTYHAWADRCPHRGMRLSHGFVRGDTLSCIYHGWQYGSDGACRYIPAHPDLTPPKTICAHQYACRTRDALVWVALEDTAADIPDVSGRMPIRSLDIALPAQTVAEKLGHPLSAFIEIGGAFDLALALQPRSEASCMIHAFAAVDQNCKQVSRHLEEMRHDLETAS